MTEQFMAKIDLIASVIDLPQGWIHEQAFQIQRLEMFSAF